MPEKTKPKEDGEKKEVPAKDSDETDAADESVWQRDQKKKSYYYDDAHGYEIYNPDEDEDEEN